MLASSASAIRETLAETLLRCAQTQSQSELIALAWTLRNRVERAVNNASDEAFLDPAEVLKVSEALLADVGVDVAREINGPQANGHTTGSQDEEMAFRQALACVSLVFDGLIPDPTNGASRVHPHDQAPAWAGDCEATALIGPLLFLRERSESQGRGRNLCPESS